MQKKQFSSIKTLLVQHDFVERISKRNKYIKTEHQDYGIRLGYRLSDARHKSLYIKLAKEIPRNLLEDAVQFALDYPETKNQGNRGRIFMWRLKEICMKNNVKIPATKRVITKKNQIKKIQTRLFK